MRTEWGGGAFKLQIETHIKDKQNYVKGAKLTIKNLKNFAH